MDWTAFSSLSPSAPSPAGLVTASTACCSNALMLGIVSAAAVETAVPIVAPEVAVSEVVALEAEEEAALGVKLNAVVVVVAVVAEEAVEIAANCAEPDGAEKSNTVGTGVLTAKRGVVVVVLGEPSPNEKVQPDSSIFANAAGFAFTAVESGIVAVAEPVEPLPNEKDETEEGVENAPVDVAG